MNYNGFLLIWLWAYMSLWFGVAVLKKRNDVADMAWGLGFIVLAWLGFYRGSGDGSRPIIINILVTIWGVRLAGHIYQRLRSRGEDYRYALWRKEWKNFYVRSYLQIFMLQGGLLWLIAWPVTYINQVGGGRGVDILLGCLIWGAGFWLESTADRQLKEFVSNPKNKGKIMNIGLWKYSRHPNYFGEIIMWWGIWVITLSQWQWWTVIGPITISLLIRYVSGVPLLEKKFEGRIDWEKYKRATSVLIPWWPKS